MIHALRVSRLLILVVLLALSAVMLTACANESMDEPVDERPVVMEDSGVMVAEIDEVEEPSVEEAVEARAEAEPPGEIVGTVEPVGEPAVEGIGEQVEAQIETLGETVTLSGTVTEVVGERTFVFAPSADAEPILVIFVGDALPAVNVSAESTMTLTGAVVAAFYIEDMEKEAGLDLEDDLLAAYEGGSAFVAISVATPE
jgi:hypothetical protein